MCRTTDSSFQSSNTLNNTGVWSLTELASLYTVPLSAVNGLSRLTTTSNGQALPIRGFSNRPITFELNLNRRIEFRSFAGPWTKLWCCCLDVMAANVLCRCKCKVTARKTFTIHRAPNVLTIQLKRYQPCLFLHYSLLRHFISVKVDFVADFG